jgi:dipeptidyl aminopeptidase/acylaminoacyl peptidase
VDEQGGVVIEGVLIKPADFDPSKRYPLLCIIHGGPTGIDRPMLLAETRTYPADIWVGRGALVLKVNYRGSAGTARSSAASTSATSGSATRGTCCRGSTT